MVKPITIHSYVADLEMIAKLEEKFINCKPDDSLRKLCKNEILQNASLLQANGSSLLGRAKTSLEDVAKTKKASEKSDYNALQRFAFRIAGVFKRCAFATKGEAAEKIAKKMTAVELKVDAEEKGGILARVANISVKKSDVKGQELLKEQLLKLSENNFTPLFETTKTLTPQDAIAILNKYDTFDDVLVKALANNFINKIVEVNPSILVSMDMIMYLDKTVYMQDDIVKAILGLKDNCFQCCVETLIINLFEDPSIAVCSKKLFDKITSKATDHQLNLLQRQ